MYLEGLLIPARALVNGGSIRVDEACTRVEYFHIELAQHAIILAEGAASETFIDDASAALFENAAERADTPERRSFAAPRLEDGYQVDAIREALAGIVHLPLAA